MSLHIRLFEQADMDEVVQLSLLAWAPAFASFESMLGPDLFARMYPDWTVSQRTTVETDCSNEACTVWVAEWDGVVAGFITHHLDATEKTGEVHLLAVHPAFQNRGIGTALNAHALDALGMAGATLVHVGTGGDPSHAAARRSYEKAGYTGLANVLFFKRLA